MSIFPIIGAWISQNTQRPRKSKNVKSKQVRETKTHWERDETKEQLKLWREANKKEKYNESPPKLTVRTDYDFDNLSHIIMEFTLGLPPQAAYDLLTNPDNVTYSRVIKGRPLLEAISRKDISKKDEGEGNELPTEEVEKELSWNFLFLSVTTPIRLYFIEKPRELLVNFRKEKEGVSFMELFEGSFRVVPMFIDAERLCEHMKPKSQEEYRKCSGGKGLIASKVKMHCSFRPASPWNVPLLSSYIRRFTVETTKKVVQDLQRRAGRIRG